MYKLISIYLLIDQFNVLELLIILGNPTDYSHMELDFKNVEIICYLLRKIEKEMSEIKNSG